MDIFRVVTDGGVVQFARAHRRRLLMVGTPILALIATIGMLGGFAGADTEPARVEPGHAVRTEPVEIAVHEARVSKTLPWDDFASEDHKYLLVRATVESRADQPLDEGTLVNALRWPAKATKAKKGDTQKKLEKIGTAGMYEATERATDVYAPRDQTSLGPLNPGIRSEVLYAWTLPTDEKVPDPLVLAVHDASFAEVTTLKRVDAWLPGDPIASLHLPTGDRAAEQRAGRKEAGS